MERRNNVPILTRASKRAKSNASNAQVKTRAFQAFLPYIGFIRVMDARNLAEPILIRFAQNFGNGKLAEISRVRHTEIERRIRFEHTRGFLQDIINVRDVFQHRVAESAGEMIRGKGRLSAIRFHKGFVRAKFLRLVDRSMPGVESHINFLIESQRGEMTVAAAHIIDRARAWAGLDNTNFRSHAKMRGSRAGHAVEGRGNLSIDDGRLTMFGLFTSSSSVLQIVFRIPVRWNSGL